MYNVRDKVGIENVTYSGNHGMEILFTNHSEYHHQVTPEMYENCLKLKAILNEKVRRNYFNRTNIRIYNSSLRFIYYY